FAAQIALPTDRVATMMDRGAPMPPPQQRQRYDRILFGMAPGGNVSVWLSAGPVVTELATFRAAPSDVPFTEIVKNPATTRQAHIQRVLEDRLGADALDALRARPERLLAWNDYPRRLAWTAQLVGATPQGAILWYKGVNGEKDWFDLADPTRGGEPLPALLPMPASLTLAWRSPAGGLSADITLDPDESVAAFRKLSGSDRPGPMTLMLEPSGTGDTVDVFLRRGDLVYRFKNTKVQVFGGS
ncbi:MAG: hypothetical protein JWN21_2532, partial [Sphingomonas bacterium]|uniref:DUF2931 family protein n=1 Tax=Sphingomonas bacterium TaxID=1895847 RepID=UPI00262BA7A7